MKFTVKRDTADLGGETVVIEVQGNRSSMADEIAQAFAIADARMWQQNARLLESREMQQKLGQIDPKAYRLLLSIIRVMTGQEPVDVKKWIESGQGPAATAEDAPSLAPPLAPPQPAADPSTIDELLAGLRQED